MSGKANLKMFVIIALVIVIIMIIAIAVLLSGALNNISGGTPTNTTGPVIEIGGSNIVDNTTNTSNTTRSGNTVANQTTTGQVDLTSSEFTTKFLKIENDSKNIIYSPLSIQYALHMLSDGAKGNTKKQIDDVIGTKKLTSYKNVDKVLSLANAIFIRDTYQNKVLGTYKNLLHDNYDADIVYDPFENAEKANKWISDKTFGIIPKMLKDEQVSDPSVKLMLINALAIDMEWKIQFDADDIYKADFTRQYGDKMEVAMMANTEKNDAISYYKGQDVTALAMDLKEYDGNQFQFLAIMPEKDLNSYIKDFSYADIENVVSNLKSSSKEKYGVSYHIPRFDYEYDLGLKSDLMKMGITDAFAQSTADFENITGPLDETLRLYVGDALHKAKIEFNEKGIKAAAVTVILMEDNAMAGSPEKQEPVVVKIDKPFLYVIRDKKTNEVWFIGATFEPEKWNDYQKKLEEAEKETIQKLRSENYNE